MSTVHTESRAPSGDSYTPHGVQVFLEHPTPSTEQIGSALDRLEENDWEYGAKMALGVLMEETGWKQAKQAHGTDRIDLTHAALQKAELISFCGWLAETYPNPEPVANLIVTQELLRENFPEGAAPSSLATHIRNFYQNDRYSVWDTAMQTAYGNRWTSFKYHGEFQFNRQWERSPIVPLSFNEQDERLALTKLLSANEEVVITPSQSPVLGHKEMDKHNVQGELRAVMRLGNPSESGVALGVVDTLGTGGFRLVSIEKGGRGLYDQIGERSVALEGREGSIPLGRVDGGVLDKLFPDGVPMTVSRDHAVLHWEADGTVRIENHHPHNSTEVQEAFAERRTPGRQLASHALQAVSHSI